MSAIDVVSMLPSQSQVSHPSTELTHEKGVSSDSLPPAEEWKPDRRFILVLSALSFATLLAGLECTVVGLSLPAIAKDLHATETVSWVGSSFLLLTTCAQPLMGSLADIFGRRPTIQLAIVLFAVGSLMGGVAKNMGTLIAGRVIQGAGGGGITVLTEIVLSDLVPLSQRGAYYGMIGMAFSIGTTIGPIIGGAFAQYVTWRLNFYIMLPFAAVSLVLVSFLNLKSPEITLAAGLAQVDWLGIVTLSGSLTGILIALSWGGGLYAWNSLNIILALVFSALGLGVYLFIEFRVAKRPSLPKILLTNRTALAGFVFTFAHGVVAFGLIYYLPIIFQSVKGHGLMRSAVDVLVTCFVLSPSAVAGGLLMVYTGDYKYIMLFGAAVQTIGLGLMSMWTVTSNGELYGYQVPGAMGVGLGFSVVLAGIQNSLPENTVALSAATQQFLRNFGGMFGVAIGATVLQSRFADNLDDVFGGGLYAFTSAERDHVLSEVSKTSALSYVDFINTLSPGAAEAVRATFARSFADNWYVLLPFSGICIVSTLVMKKVALRTTVESDYGLKDKPAEIEAGNV
ncbi:hypothetical protein OC846_004985 [Tilletia horrida]|uniref:Major facilitator superfamily (MFS) profile domain-containing protein n=1 Tax=Tilletia horrida TaxID=155126 RepID=A0AAN6JQN5_9BASI|nr:hypothetical protein OC846_004985 [Tilletia horrida]KAK0562699.1 hypothetical protein OC861_005188 [Tilletia horrida]